MKDFVLIFRNDSKAQQGQSPQQMQEVMKQWMDWMGGIAAQNKLADKGNRLGSNGKTVRPNNVITDGPYTEIKEVLGGYIIVSVNSLDEAVDLAKSCPILKIGGNVEVRNVVDINGK